MSVMGKKTAGELASNGSVVLSLQTTLSRVKANLDLVPKLIQELAADDGWREFIHGHYPDGVFRWGQDDFHRFIESPRKEGGCETPLSVLERLLKGTPAWGTFL